MGGAYDALRQYPEAVEYHQQFLTIAQEIGERRWEELAYFNLGITHNALGQCSQAIEYHQKSLNLAIELGDRKREWSAYKRLGNVNSIIGNYNEAVEYYTKGVKVAIKIGDRNGEGRAYCDLGVLNGTLNKHQTAIEYYLKHLEIVKELGDRVSEGKAYSSLGSAYSILGNYAKGMEYHTQSLTMAIQTGDKDLLGMAYSNIGDYHQRLGRYQEAFRYHKKCLDIAIASGDRSAEGTAYCNLGIGCFDLRDFHKAIEFQDKHLNIVVSRADKKGEEIAYRNLGCAYFALGKYQEAIEYHKKSLSIATEIKDKRGEGMAYGNLGLVYRIQGHCHLAIEYYQKYLPTAKELNDKYGEGKCYNNLGDAYFSLYVIDKSSSQQEKDDAPKPGATAITAIKEAEQCFKESLQCYDWIFEHIGHQDSFKITIIDSFIHTYKLLTAVYIETEQPEKALLVSEHKRGRALEDILSGNVLESDNPLSFHRGSMQELKALLEETLADEENPNRNSNALHVLVDKVYMTVCARGARTCENRSLDIVNVDGSEIERAAGVVGQDSRGSSRAVYDEELNEDYLEILFDALITPVQHNLTHDEIVIIPDGPLHKVPFAALRDPITKSFLSETKRIRLVPSLTTLKILKESSAESHSMTGALIVGDPDATTQRWYKGKTRSFMSLPNAKLEAERIGEVLGVTPITGVQATKEVIKQRLREGVAIIHFAAHGCSDSGEIVLSPGSTLEDEDTIPEEEDYLLTIKEVQTIGLRARLVVLSCCHSGRGAINSEGVLGISRAFLAAGALAVVASLWAVDDRATRVFMELFYAHLKQGKSASTSLQHAMSEMRQTRQYNKPIYWAPFFLIGEDVTISL
ncbi:hypothetical protein QZH41_008528 [Actinostola sp. cb2023]|nr:hypothetical protein QZH41_008528 [Actinostola sp. cb2023]